MKTFTPEDFALVCKFLQTENKITLKVMPKDVEIVTFVDGDDMYVSIVGLNEDYKARKYEDYTERSS